MSYITAAAARWKVPDLKTLTQHHASNQTELSWRVRFSASDLYRHLGAVDVPPEDPPHRSRTTVLKFPRI